MSDDILIKSKAIPSNPRSKNYPAGTTVVRSGGGTTTITGGGGSSIDILKVDDMRSLTDRNVFSSLRTLSELMSRIVKSDDSERELTDENVLSSLRASNQLKAAVDELNASIKSLEDVYLFKTKDDTTAGHLTIEGGTTTDLLQSSQFTPGTLGAGYLIKYDPITGKSYIEVDEMYVRLKAVFDSLVIKESQHVGGQQIYSCTSLECTKVDHIYREALFDSDHKRLRDSEGKYLFALLPSPVYRCYFTSTDGSKTILNQFVPGDLAQCRQFDIKDGTTGHAKNRYYWRYVVAVGDNYIDLSVTDCEEGSDVPEAGDKIIQLGNRTDVSRQNAIIMSAYGENAPSKQMLQGIDSYSLADKVVLEEGFDMLTNQAYTKTFGRNYVGAKDKSSYMEYTQEHGLELRGAIKGVSDDGGSVYELMPDGTSFFGVTNPVTKKKTGIIQGVDCMVAEEKRTGIFSVVDDAVVFEMDPINKRYKFTGEVNATSGIFDDVYVNGLYFEKWSVIDNPGNFAELQFLSPNILITGSLNPFALYLRLSFGGAIAMKLRNPYFFKIYNMATFICSIKLQSSDSTFKVFYKNGEVKNISALNLNGYTFAELMFIPKKVIGIDKMFYSGDWFVMNYTSFNATLLADGMIELASKPMA